MKRLLFNIAELDNTVVHEDTGIWHPLFIQSLQWFFSQYCIHLQRSLRGQTCYSELQ